MLSLIRLLIKDVTGVAAVEYGLITALIAVAMIPGLMLAGQGLDHVFFLISDGL